MPKEIIECAGGIVKYDNRIALVKMKRVDGWGFPKGKIEPGESPFEAAKREVMEETGIKDLSFVKDLGMYSRSTVDGEDKSLNIHMFLFHSDQEEIEPILDDVKGARWCFQNEIEKCLYLDSDRNYYQRIKADI